ncbi:hypothetical protein FRC18_007446 [Serendipita sp. 400]|nr:hypothetical protein FRC18_007446 [Serendipita sp. 400]
MTISTNEAVSVEQPQMHIVSNIGNRKRVKLPLTASKVRVSTPYYISLRSRSDPSQVVGENVPSPEKHRQKHSHGDADALSEEEDQLEGPNGWNPSLRDLDRYCISDFAQDLPLNRIDTKISVEAVIDRHLARIAFNIDDMLESLAISSPDDRPDPHIIGSGDRVPAVSAGSTPDDRLDFRLFKESVRMYLRYMIGVSPRTPAAELPCPCKLGPFSLDFCRDISDNGNVQASIFFIDSYLEAHQQGSFPSLYAIQPEFISKPWVSLVFRDYFLWIKHSTKAYANKQYRETRLQRKRRQERRRAKLRLRMNQVTHQAEMSALLRSIGPDGMSDEESDTDEDGPFFWTSRPFWRSNLLSGWLRSLDELRGTSSVSRRIPRNYVDTLAVIPQNLPAECYIGRFHAPMPTRTSRLVGR